MNAVGPPHDDLFTLVLETRDVSRDLQKDVTNLDAKFEEMKKAVEDRHTDHEHRLRSLEKKVWLAAGIAAVAGAGLWETLSGTLSR